MKEYILRKLSFGSYMKLVTIFSVASGLVIGLFLGVLILFSGGEIEEFSEEIVEYGIDFFTGTFMFFFYPISLSIINILLAIAIYPVVWLIIKVLRKITIRATMEEPLDFKEEQVEEELTNISERKISERKKNRNKGIWSIVLWVMLTFSTAVIVGLLEIPSFDELELPDFEIPIRGILLAICIPSIILAAIFAFMYRKNIAHDFKNLNRRHYSLIAIGALIAFAISIVSGLIMQYFDIVDENSELITQIFSSYPLIISIVIILLAPFVEEIVFRKGFSSILKNNVAFVIVSSLAFGLMHGFGFAALTYVAIGFFLSILYIKMNRNVVAITMVHLINNLVATLAMILTANIS